MAIWAILIPFSRYYKHIEEDFAKICGFEKSNL